MSNPNHELEILQTIRQALFRRTSVAERVQLRRATGDGREAIDISPDRTDLTNETQNRYEYLMVVNVDLGALADEPDAVVEMLKLHAEVNTCLVPLAERNLDLAYVVKVDRTGAEELSVGEGQTIKMVRRTTWEVTYRTLRTE